MRSLYQFVTKSYSHLIRAVAPFNIKAKKWVDGRKDSMKFLSTHKIEGRVIWFHTASLGEFEQGKPVMEAFKKANPDWKLVITFFSPSGYDARKDYKMAESVLYLPIENNSNISLFLDVVNPEIAVFVKYEFWYGYMERLASRNIPLLFICASFRESQVFFKWYGGWFLDLLKKSNFLFVQEESSKKILETNGLNQVEVSGDTRFDRVFDTFVKSESLLKVESFKGGEKILIFGSAWEVETDLSKIILQNLPKGWKIIYAPHEINKLNIDKYRNDLTVPSVLFSEFNEKRVGDELVLIVDTIGHLARVYKYANVAIVGGGFTDGIHNILEPLVFGCPVFFGPDHSKFWEGEAVISNGIGFQFRNELELMKNLEPILNNEEILEKLSIECQLFVESRRGATEVITNYLCELAK